MITVVLFVVTGGVFFAKGLVEVIERFGGRVEQEATLLETETTFTVSNNDAVTLYKVRGELASGESFEVTDERLYDIATGRTPLPVRVELTQLSGRVVAVRSDFGTVEGVGGAAGLRLGIFGLVLGIALLIIPFVVPFRSGERKQAVQNGEVPPPIDWAGFTVVLIVTVLVVGGTLAWDVLR